MPNAYFTIAKPANDPFKGYLPGSPEQAELKAELKKVSWPSRADTLKKTGIVIACVIVVGVIVWIFDGIASSVIDALLSIFGH